MQPPQPPPEKTAPDPPETLDDPMLYCPVCSLRLEGQHCKLRCPQCGYYMSCADYY